MPAANAVFTIASQWDSPPLICKTDANGDAAVPLEHTIADNKQHWYAPVSYTHLTLPTKA